MTFRFRSFRQFLSGLMILLSCVCVGLTLSSLQVIVPTSIAWLALSVHTSSILRGVFSLARKPLLKEIHSVASEAIWLFVLFPFHLVLALLILTAPFTPASIRSSYIPLFLQLFILLDAIFHTLYGVGLILVTILTVPAFDRDVWRRDIDASPSPFPIPILLAFYFPCCCSLPSSDMDDNHIVPSAPCLSGCNCAIKLPVPDMTLLPEITRPVVKGGVFRSSGSLSQTLVRVPNAAERRSYIAVAFEV